MDVFLDGPESRVGDAVHIVFAGERTRPDQPEPNAQVEEGEDAGDFRLVTLEALVRMKLSAFRDKDRVHLRDLLGVGLDRRRVAVAAAGDVASAVGRNPG